VLSSDTCGRGKFGSQRLLQAGPRVTRTLLEGPSDFVIGGHSCLLSRFCQILWFLRISAVRSLGALGHLRRRWRDLRTRSGLLWTECAVAAAVFARWLRRAAVAVAVV
jgi:hypothetical protein